MKYYVLLTRNTGFAFVAYQLQPEYVPVEAVEVEVEVEGDYQAAMAEAEHIYAEIRKSTK